MPRTGSSSSIYITRKSGTPFVNRDTPLCLVPDWFRAHIANRITFGHEETDCWYWEGPLYHGKPVIYVPTEPGARSTVRVLVDKYIAGHYWNFDPSLSERTIFCARRCDILNCVNPAHIIPGTSVNDYA